MRSISPSSSSSMTPVPYLFGGLAAMLGLIAFALLLLCCSYWKLSIQSEERDLEAGNNNNNGENQEKTKEEQQQMKVYEEKILVIMAGDQKPSFLATPLTPKLSNSFSQSNHVSSDRKLHNHVLNEMDPNFGKLNQLGHHDQQAHQAAQ